MTLCVLKRRCRFQARESCVASSACCISALEAEGGVVGAKCAQRVLLVFRVPGRRLVDVLLFCMHFSGSCHLSVTSL